MMLGTDISTKGGISSVIKDCLDYGIFNRLGINYNATHKDGSKISKLLFFVTQFPIILCKMPFSKIVHFQSSRGWSYRRLFILFLIAKVYRKKTIWHIHSGNFDTYYNNSCLFEKNIINFGFNHADIIIVLSEYWKEKLQAIAPNTLIEVIPNGVNVSKYQVTNRKIHTPMTVLFLGKLGEQKGTYDILRAIEILANKNIFFILAGNGDTDEVKKIINNKNLDKIVDVPGWVSGDEKQSLLLKSDIYILPSYNEGLPMSILEAMAAGLPIISTPVGGIPDAVIEGENGYLITPGDFEALASTLLMLDRDHNLWKKMSLGSHKIVKEKYDMPRIESDLDNLYKNLSR